MGNYAVIRKDRVPYPLPLNVLHTEETPLENGMIVGIKGYAENERECYKIGLFAEGDEYGILDCSTLLYDERLDDSDYCLKKDYPGRVIVPKKYDEYTVAAKLFPEGLAVGDYVKPDTATIGKYTKATTKEEAIARVAEVSVDFDGQDSILIDFL